MWHNIQRALVAGLLALCVAGHASAQMIDRPVKVVVGFPAGGGLDIMARIVADAMRAEMDNPVVVENRPGAGSLIAAGVVANAEPDGRTLLVAPVVVTAFFPFIHKKMSFDPMKDLVPVAQLGTFQFALAVGKDVPVRDLGGLVDHAKSHPMSYASLSAGTPAHFLGVMFNRAAGTQMLHVPYKGAAPAMAALQSGEVTAAFATTGSVVELHKDGRIRAVAVTGEARSSLMPDVPTFTESSLGLDAMRNASLWYGYFAPGGTPANVVEQLNAVITRVLKRDDIRTRIAAFDLQPGDMSAEAFAALVRRDYENWGRVIRSTGFTID